MTQYAKYIDEHTIIYPTNDDFPGIINWDKNDSLLRKFEFYPLVGTHEDREGYNAIPSLVSLHKSSVVITKRLNFDPITKELFIENAEYEDPITHEIIRITQNVFKDVEVTRDTSYIEVLEWTYEEIPESDEEVHTREFESACVQFRAVCAEIGQFIGVDDFTGGFDEYAIFINSEAAISNPQTATALAMKWSAMDKLCTYLGSKIGLGQPEWWYRCWEINNNGDSSE